MHVYITVRFGRLVGTVRTQAHETGNPIDCFLGRFGKLATASSAVEGGGGGLLGHVVYDVVRFRVIPFFFMGFRWFISERERVGFSFMTRVPSNFWKK